MDAGITPSSTIDPIALERGDVRVFAAAPFPLPSEADQAFLREQELFRLKEIVFEPRGDRMAGYRVTSGDQDRRLRQIFDAAGRDAGRWLAEACPQYAAVARPLRTSFHVAEEAIRSLRVTARNDLLHVDALHHAAGQRILRVFVNLSPTDPRVWATSDTLAKILSNDNSRLSLPTTGWPSRLGHEMLRLFRGPRVELDPFDETMLALSRSMKHSDEFQEKSPRRIWNFAPGQSWMAFTDALVHADLRGRWVLDHLFLIPTQLCAAPEASPLALLGERGPKLKLAS